MNTPSSTTHSSTQLDTATATTADTVQGVPVLAVTEAALATVLDVRASEDDPGSMALKVAITGANMTEYAYALELAPIADAQDGANRHFRRAVRFACRYCRPATCR